MAGERGVDAERQKRCYGNLDSRGRRFKRRHGRARRNAEKAPVATDRRLTEWNRAPIIPPREDGAVAQLGERVVRNDEVVGSIPIGSTIFSIPAKRGREGERRPCPSA